MILNYQFRIGDNIIKQEITCNLSRIRNYSVLAEIEARNLEKNNKPFDKKTYMNFKFHITNNLQLANFNDQVSKIKACISDIKYLDDILYLASKVIELEGQMAAEQQFVYHMALNDFENLQKLIDQYYSKELNSIEMLFTDNRNSLSDKIVFNGDHPKKMLSMMIEYYTTNLLRQYELLLIEIFKKKIPDRNFSYNNVKATIDYLKNAAVNRPYKVMRISLIRSIHEFLQQNKIFKKEKKLATEAITTDEARVMYVILCLFSLQPIIEKKSEPKEIRRPKLRNSEHESYNDPIINRIKKIFNDIVVVNKHLIADYKLSDNTGSEILELLTNTILK